MQAKRMHKINIIGGLSHFLYLLIIPMVRGFVLALRGGGITAWLAGAWFDVLVIVSIILLGFFRWYLTLYVYNEDGITISKGVFVKKQSFIPKSQVYCLSVVSPFYLKPFRAVKLRADTPAGSFRQADFILTVTKDEAWRMMGIRIHDETDSSFVVREYKPKNIHILALSLLTSNSFAGIVFLTTFISQSGQLLGEEFSNRIYGTFEKITRIMAFGIPPAAAFLAYLLLAGWAMNFLANLVRHKNFLVRRDCTSLYIRSGIFTNRKYDLYKKSLCFVDIRQSVLTKILGIYSIFIYAIGYGKDKSDVSVLVPASTKKELESSLELLLPEFKQSKRQLKPNMGAIFKFIIEPFWPCSLIPLATLFIGYKLPSWAQLIYFLGFMASVPSYWFLMVRLIDFFTSGISREGDVYTLRYSKGYYLHTVILPKEKITVVNVRQSILQKGDDKCDLVVYCYSELIKRHHCKNLDRKAVLELFEI